MGVKKLLSEDSSFSHRRELALVWNDDWLSWRRWTNCGVDIAGGPAPSGCFDLFVVSCILLRAFS